MTPRPSPDEIRAAQAILRVFLDHVARCRGCQDHWSEAILVRLDVPSAAAVLHDQIAFGPAGPPREEPR